MARNRRPRKNAPRAARDREAPAIGNASEADRLPDEPALDAKSEELVDGLGYGADDGPESQGASAGRGFGEDGQGTFGDEDYDLSYGPTGLAGPEEIDDAERGADTPERIDWDVTSGDAANAVANEEREVATGDLSALEEVHKKTTWSDGDDAPVRADDRIREEIQEILAELGEEVEAEVTMGEVVLLGSVPTDERRDQIDELVQEIDGVRAIDNRIRVLDDETSE